MKKLKISTLLIPVLLGIFALNAHAENQKIQSFGIQIPEQSTTYGKIVFINEEGDSIINHNLNTQDLSERKYFVSLNDLQPGLYQILFLENREIIDQETFTYNKAASASESQTVDDEDKYLSVSVGANKRYILFNNINNHLKNGSEITICDRDKKVITKMIIDHKSTSDQYKLAIDLIQTPEIFINVDNKLLASVKDY